MNEPAIPVHTGRMTITIHLNGQAQTVTQGTSVTHLVATLNPDPRGIAVERNREIVPKSAWPTTLLEEGDRLEVVVFVGGG